MSWGNPEILKQLADVEATEAQLSELEKTCARLEALAQHPDTSTSTQARTMLAAIPVMREVQTALERRDFAGATETCVGIADGLACLAASLIASMPPGVEATMRVRIEQTLVRTLKAAGR